MTEPEDPMAAYRRLKKIQDVERQAFYPSSILERLVLQVMGGWENLKTEVNLSRFTAAGPAADWVD